MRPDDGGIEHRHRLRPARRTSRPRPSRAPSRRQPRIRDIDFSRPTKFSQEHQRRIVRLHETFCRAIGTQLSAELRLPLEFQLISTTQMSWASATGELPAASLFGIMDVLPGRGARAARLRAAAPPVLPRPDARRRRALAAAARRADRDRARAQLAADGAADRAALGRLGRVGRHDLRAPARRHADLERPARDAERGRPRPDRRGQARARLLDLHRASSRTSRSSRSSSSSRSATSASGARSTTTAGRCARRCSRSTSRCASTSARSSSRSTRRCGSRPGQMIEFGPIEAGVRLFGGDTATHICRPGRIGEFRAVEILSQDGGHARDERRSTAPARRVGRRRGRRRPAQRSRPDGVERGPVTLAAEGRARPPGAAGARRRQLRLLRRTARPAAT